MSDDASSAPTSAELIAHPRRAQFAPDDLLAERFRVIRFVAAGGMGEVYEADDLELHERVALKTIRAGIADDERAMDRFRSEIQLARRVTHPGVCRTYDVFRHRLPGGGSAAFLSMELLIGETLASRLRRGRLPFEEARSVGLQVAAGLAAAHDAGVLHRDLKSANIVLVPGEKGVRAVITDFGLARDARSPAGPEGVLGTPGYMAPEQIEGRGSAVSTDVYTLGVVLYEMVTGRRPTLEEPELAPEPAEATPTSDAPLAAALARLQARPRAPRSLAPELPASWNAAILRCLERDPAARFASAHEVLVALAPPAPRWPRLLAAGLVIAALFGGAVLERLRQRSAPARRSIAVLGFRNLADRPETAWLATALSETLTAELAAGGRLRTVPPETVARVRLELGLTENVGAAALSRLRGSLGSDLVVSGTYLAEPGGRLRVDLSVQEQGETVAVVSGSGSDTRLAELLGRIGAELRAQLGIDSPAPAAAGLLPGDPEAARAYAEGLARLRLFDALAARDLLQRAVELEPGFPLAHAALADAWTALGHDAHARESARRAVELAARLPRAEQLAVEARYREASHDWPQAIEVNRTLARFFPDDLEHGLRLAAAQTAGGQGKDALATLEALRRLPPPASSDPRLDLAEADAAHALADERRSLAAATEAGRKGQAIGARLLVARARFQQAWSLRVLGDLPRAATACDEARATFAAVGDRVGVARSLNLTATVRLGQGNPQGARAAAGEALAISREIGHQTSVAGALNHLSNVLRQRGELAAASGMLEQSLAIQRELGDRLEQAIALDIGAGVKLARGRLAEAEEGYQQALAIRPQIGDRRGEAFDLTGLGRVLLERGDAARARPPLERALQIRREIANKAGVAESLLALGELALLQGDLRAARRDHDEALAIRVQMLSAAPVAQARAALARVLLAEGDAAAAERTGREAREMLEQVGLMDEAAAARAVEARALLAQGRRDAARPSVQALLAHAVRTEQPALRIASALVAAQLDAAEGQQDAARRRLAQAVAEANGQGLQLRALEARLALARLGAVASEVEAVEREAHERGLDGLVRGGQPPR
jgi:tetratricopeptide (TPR) repeat protein/TolB-like protein/tRNA A-37 threonylcarbamoyl transferase component Bud32